MARRPPPTPANHPHDKRARVLMTMALDHAGHVGLRKVMREVMFDSILTTDGQQDAAIDDFFRRLREHDYGFDMLLVLFETDKATRARALFNETNSLYGRIARATDPEKTAAGSDHRGDDTQLNVVAPPPSASASSAPRIGRGTVVRPMPPANRSRRTLDAMVNAAQAVTRGLLSTFMVNGKPLGDVPVSEGWSWAVARERDGRFVKLLLADVINTNPDALIKDVRTDEDAATCYARAEVIGNDYNG